VSISDSTVILVTTISLKVTSFVQIFPQICIQIFFHFSHDALVGLRTKTELL